MVYFEDVFDQRLPPTPGRGHILEGMSNLLQTFHQCAHHT